MELEVGKAKGVLKHKRSRPLQSIGTRDGNMSRFQLGATKDHQCWGLRSWSTGDGGPCAEQSIDQVGGQDEGEGCRRHHWQEKADGAAVAKGPSSAWVVKAVGAIATL